MNIYMLTEPLKGVKPLFSAWEDRTVKGEVLTTKITFRFYNRYLFDKAVSMLPRAGTRATVIKNWHTSMERKPPKGSFFHYRWGQDWGQDWRSKAIWKIDIEFFAKKDESLKRLDIEYIIESIERSCESQHFPSPTCIVNL